MKQLKNRLTIKGTSSFFPKKILTNLELVSRINSTEEWIEQRTGIKQRHIISEDESVTQLAINCAMDVIDKCKVNSKNIDAIIVATTTQDSQFPSTANYVQQALDIPLTCFSFDIQAACSGFVYAMYLMQSVAEMSPKKDFTGIIIGVEAMSRIVDWDDRGTCILFGDAAGSMILSTKQHSISTKDNIENGREGDMVTGFIDGILLSDTSKTGDLFVDNQYKGNRSYLNNKISMNGREVFKVAVEGMIKVIETIVNRNNITNDDVDWVVAHQANIRILEAVSQSMKIDFSKFTVTIQNTGNTSAASIPIAMESLENSNKLKNGDKIIFVSAGAGMTFGAILFVWEKNKN